MTDRSKLLLEGLAECLGECDEFDECSVCNLHKKCVEFTIMRRSQQCPHMDVLDKIEQYVKESYTGDEFLDFALPRISEFIQKLRSER